MNKETARHYIEFAILNNIIMGPNQVRYLYECAEYPMPEHLMPEILTDEEKEKRYEVAEKLFKVSAIEPKTRWSIPESFEKSNLKMRYNSPFGKSVIEDIIPMQLNGSTNEEMRGYVKTWWDKPKE